MWKIIGQNMKQYFHVSFLMWTTVVKSFRLFPCFAITSPLLQINMNRAALIRPRTYNLADSRSFFREKKNEKAAVKFVVGGDCCRDKTEWWSDGASVAGWSAIPTICQKWDCVVIYPVVVGGRGGGLSKKAAPGLCDRVPEMTCGFELPSA